MGEFILSSIRIKRAKNGNKYIVAKMKDLNNPSAKEVDYPYPLFSEVAVKLYEPYLSFANGGKSDSDKQIPKEYLKIYGEYYYYTPGVKFFKKHSKDDLKNKIRKGDYVRDTNGKVVVYEKLLVFCRQYINEDGSKEFADKESPREVGVREFKYCCESYSKGLEDKLNNKNPKSYCASGYNETNNNECDDYLGSLYYDDGIDMDQQNQKYWEDLGLF